MSINLGWLNRNCLRSYPIKEDALRRSISSGWIMPNNVVADAMVLFPGIDDQVYIASITITPKIISIGLALQSTGALIGSVSAVLGVDGAFAQKPITPILRGVSGFVTFGTILLDSSFDGGDIPMGLHLFSSDSVLESRCVLGTGEFPIKSLSGYGFPILDGRVEFQTGSLIQITATPGVDSGDPITYLTFSLTDPTSFLSPCETPTSPCQCLNVPIHSINGVTGNVDGTIFIEIVDERGLVTGIEDGVLNFSILRNGDQICTRPIMPDDYGRLPNSAGKYDGDEKPITPYKDPADTTFPEPIL